MPSQRAALIEGEKGEGGVPESFGKKNRGSGAERKKLGHKREGGSFIWGRGKKRSTVFGGNDLLGMG